MSQVSSEYPQESGNTTADSPERPDKVSRPGWPELGVAAVVAIALYAVGILLFLQIPGEQAILGGLTQYAISGLAPLGGFAAAVMLRIRDVRPFGLRRVSWKWLAIAAGVGIGMIIANIAMTTVVFTLTDTSQSVQANYQSAAAGGLAPFLCALVLGAILTPIGEEVLFRGVLANALSKYGPWIAVLGSSAIFAVSHGVNYLLPVAFVAGVAAALLLRRTGSVWPGVVVHAVNNGYSVIAPAVIALAA